MSAAAQARQKNAALTASRPTKSCAASAKGGLILPLFAEHGRRRDDESSFGYFSCKKSDRLLVRNGWQTDLIRQKDDDLPPDHNL